MEAFSTVLLPCLLLIYENVGHMLIHLYQVTLRGQFRGHVMPSRKRDVAKLLQDRTDGVGKDKFYYINCLSNQSRDGSQAFYKTRCSRKQILRGTKMRV